MGLPPSWRRNISQFPNYIWQLNLSRLKGYRLIQFNLKVNINANGQGQGHGHSAVMVGMAIVMMMMMMVIVVIGGCSEEWS